MNFSEVAKILYGTIFVFGIIGNSLVIYVVLRFSRMRTITNIYLFNLALADWLSLLYIPFYITKIAFHTWLFGRIMCKLYSLCYVGTHFTRSLLLTAMTVHRYVDVRRPIYSLRYRSLRTVKLICLTAWTVSALLMVPVYIYSDTADIREFVSCHVSWPENKLMDRKVAFFMYLFLLGFAVPLVFISLFYFLIICNLQNDGSENHSQERKRSHRKVTGLVLAVINVYVMCLLAYWIHNIYVILLSEIYIVNFFFDILLCCYLAMNPILYAFKSQNFRKSFVKAFTCATRMEVNAQLNDENNDCVRNNRSASDVAHSNNKQTSRVESNSLEMSIFQYNNSSRSSRIELELRPPTALTSESSIVV